MRFFRAKIAFLTACFLLAGGAAFVRAVRAQETTTGVTPMENAAGVGPTLDVAEAPIRTAIPIPGSRLEALASGAVVGRVRDLADYLNVIYNFLISTVGVVAAIMMMVGGFGYLTSGGDPGRAKVGRERISNALIGLILALSSYVILNTVNPELVRLKVPDVSPVKTVTSFMPFCDELAEQLNANWSQVVPAPTTRSAAGCYACGCPGYILMQQTDDEGRARLDSQGNPIQVRRWCTMRGNKDGSGAEATRTKRDWSGYFIKGGCGESQIFTAEVRNDDYSQVPQVCLPSSKVTSDQLEEEFVKGGVIDRESQDKTLAFCMACPLFEDSEMRMLGYPAGPESCQVWMNIANNGDPRDNSFNVSNKAATNWTLDTLRPKQMYYCGYSRDRRSCVYSGVHCGGKLDSRDRGGVNSCDDYNDEYLQFCNDVGAGYQQCKDEEFISIAGDYADHLSPICLSDPCNLSSRCQQGDVYEAANVVGAGSEASVAFQILTGGIVNSAKCE